jgi:delta-aminolevulinic acid dehydratase/porphobilinogen synthase
LIYSTSTVNQKLLGCWLILNPGIENMLNQKHELIHSSETIDLTRRPRRNRKSAAVRALVQETRLHPSNFVAPLFLLEGQNARQEIPSMPGVARLSIDLAIKEISELYQLGVRAVDLFTLVPQEKKRFQGLRSCKE